MSQQICIAAFTQLEDTLTTLQGLDEQVVLASEELKHTVAALMFAHAALASAIAQQAVGEFTAKVKASKATAH